MHAGVDHNVIQSLESGAFVFVLHDVNLCDGILPTLELTTGTAFAGL